MLDTQSLREEAFQHLHMLPHFCSDVILLIEELEKVRENISVKDGMLEDDARIIHGLVEHYRLMETALIASTNYINNRITKEEYESSWDQFQERIFARS